MSTLASDLEIFNDNYKTVSSNGIVNNFLTTLSTSPYNGQLEKSGLDSGRDFGLDY